MATNNDLMNTQTGGEGETVQIQTQEQITPEQFDVKIKAQETPVDSEQQVIPTQQPTEPPVEPPVQREGMAEVQGAVPSEFYEAQESFSQPPVELPVVDPAQIAAEDPEYFPFQPEKPITKEEDPEYFPFVDPTLNNIKQFKDTESQINQDLNNSELGQVVKLYDENKERGDGIFGKIKGFFKRKEEEPKQETVNIGGIQLALTKGDEISKEDFVAAGGDPMAMNIPIPDPTKNPEESGVVNKPLTFEESITTEDLSKVVDEGTVISEFNKLVLEREKVREQIKTAQGEELKSLRKNLKSIKGTLNDLKKSDDFKQQKDQYTQNILKKGALPADYYSEQEANIYKPISPDLTYHPSNYMIIKPFEGIGSKIFSGVIDKVSRSGGDDGLLRAGLYTSSSYKINEPDDLIKELFIPLVDLKKLDQPVRDGWWTHREYAQSKIRDVIYGYAVGGTSGEQIRPSLKYEDVIALDKYFRNIANWAKENGGKQKDGKLKSVLFPEGSVLVPVTVEVNDYLGRLKTVTLFEGIYDTEENRAEVRNKFGMPWNKASFQYTGAEIISSQSRPYYVPEATMNLWKKSVKGFDKKVFQQQQNLAIKKDKNGNPYLQSDAGVFGVGITGVMDKATKDAQKRYEADLNKSRNKPSTVVAGDITLKGEFDFGPKVVETFKNVKDWKNSNLTYGNYNIKNIPVEKMRSVSDAIIWATNNLPTATKVEFNDPNIFEKDQESFKSYIESLGLKGITVKPLGTWLVGDFDYVRIDGAGKSLMIDLGENDSDLNKNQLKRLSDWLSVAQDDPKNDFIEAYTANFDKDYYVSKMINKKVGLGETFTLSFPNKRGKTITVTNKSGQLDAQEYLNEIEFNHSYYEEIKNGVEANIENYSNQVQPYIQKFQDIQNKSNIEISALEKQLNDLDYKRNNNQISDEDFSSSTKLINDKIIKLSNNLVNSYGELQKSVGNNKAILDLVNEDSEKLEIANANLKIMADDINELAGIEMARVQADNTGPKTVVGHVVGAFTNGYAKPFIAAISAGSDLLIAAGFYPEGMTKEEAYKQNNEWKANFLYGTFTDALESSLGTKMGIGYESRLSFTGKAVYGAVESVGTQGNPLVRAFKGTALEGAASMIGFASQSYTQIEEEIVKNPELKDIPEYQRKLMTLPYAIVMAAIDKYAYGKMTKGSSSVTQRLMVSTINQALKRLPKNATLEQIEAVIKGDVKSNIGKFIAASHRAGVTEFETETLQAAALDVGLKELWDNVLEKDAFNTGSVFEDFMGMVIEQGKAGYIGGLALGAAFRTVEFATTNKINLINPSDYDFFKVVSSDPQLKKVYAQQVANDFVSGKIDKASAEKAMLDFENLAALDRKISDEITGEDRVKMVDLMLQKQKIQQRMSELDESQKAIPNPALEIIDKQIGEIVTRTETKVKEQQQYDQENETGIPGEIREGQEPITTQPIEGASDQATPTSGVVQETQEVTPTEEITTGTQVTPTEEVVTETEITPTEPQKITSVMTTGETQVESDLIGTDVSTGKQLKTADIQTGEMTSEFREDKNPTKGTVVNVEADPKNKNIERLILEDGTVLNRNKNTGAITLNNKVKATTKETEVKTETAVTNEFDELADINKLPLAKRTKAKNAFSEKYGDKADKIIKIDSNFTSIVSKLESQKLITKKNC